MDLGSGPVRAFIDTTLPSLQELTLGVALVAWEDRARFQRLAIDVRGYSDFVPMGASVSAMRSTEEIMWTVQFRNPEIKPKRFKFPIRRGVSEGQIQPHGHFPTGTDDLNSPLLMGEPSALNTEQGPVKLGGLAELALSRSPNGGK